MAWPHVQIDILYCGVCHPFCAERGIASDVEVISIQQINEAYARVLKNDVKYRFVIDMASLAAG